MAKSPAAPAVPKACQSLANAVADGKTALAELQAEYNTAQGTDKSRLFYLVRDAREALGQDEVKLNTCINPPPALPDLVATGIVTRFHTDRKFFDFAVLIKNAGAGPASGTFKITVGLEYYDYSQSPALDVFGEQDFQVSQGNTIAAGATYTSQYWTNVAFSARPGSSVGSYTFYVLVDADNQIAESNEANNNYQVTQVLRPPLLVLPITSGVRTGTLLEAT